VSEERPRGIIASTPQKRDALWVYLVILVPVLAALAMTVVSIGALVADGPVATTWMPYPEVPWGSGLARVPALLAAPFYGATTLVFAYLWWSYARKTKSREWHLERHRRRMARRSGRD
jgi:hypothetical protein